jgi:hypothetical protein
MRALLERLLGHGLGRAEELRRQTYAILVTLAIKAIFALTFQGGDLFSPLLVGVEVWVFYFWPRY